ncbi:MAG: sulfite exporter TauE/SafE family protein [Myxococcaceae bacterium]|jgi:sulfite exporter TauE/SafE|nr:sulfite exporter TauE/SafE family protein [Myxococcaceae bacterium]MCA3013421.1 sulfite exporter TauE/SafE family protein [Myxococcaceae bacterium]
MSAPLVLAGASSALVAGATGSLHCALMCGPLACAGLPKGAGRQAAMVAWHAGRLSGYVALGLALGSVGTGLSRALAVSVQPVLPWLMAAGLVATALELGKRLRPLPFAHRLSSAMVRAAARLHPAWRSFVIGLATPLLPCGLLAGVFLAAMATGGALGGGALMGAFALGAVPALASTQAGAGLGARWPTLSWAMRRAVPLFAAGVLVYRAVLATTLGPACR